MKFFISLAAALSCSTLAIRCTAQTLPKGLFSIGPFEILEAIVEVVQSRLGVNRPIRIEPGEGADRALCYSASTSPSAPTVVFETGALGGWKWITAFRLTKRGDRQCQIADSSLIAMSTANGLSLGAKRQLVEQALNKSNPVISRQTMRVEEIYQRRPTESEVVHIRRSGSDPDRIVFDVIDTVEVRFKHGVLDDLFVRRLVSN